MMKMKKRKGNVSDFHGMGGLKGWGWTICKGTMAIFSTDICIWAFCRGGGAGYFGQNDAKSAPFRHFLHVVGRVIIEKLVPPHFGYGEFKNEGPMAK